MPKDIPMRWDQLQTLLRVLPEPSDVERLLLKLHGKTSLGDLGIDGSLREDILHWSPLVRNRMTFMRLLHTMETETLL